MDLEDVFDLGTTIEYIRNSDLGGHEVKGKGWLLDSFNLVFPLLTECDIEDEVIWEEITKWARKLDRNYKKGQKISKKDGKELSEDAEGWVDLIYKELCARPFIEFRTGALDQKALVRTSEGKPSGIFERDIWKALPKIAKSDFADSAKCLLIGASTPATMVALRGIEAVMRKYYTLRTKKSLSNKNLGTIIKELKEIPKINKKLLDYMDYIRSEKRNIAQHPTKIFNQKEAERIFMEIICATHDILSETLPASSKKS